MQCANHIQQLDLAGEEGWEHQGFKLIFLGMQLWPCGHRDQKLIFHWGEGMEVFLGVPEGQLSPLHYMISWEASPGYNFLSGVWLLNGLISQL